MTCDATNECAVRSLCLQVKATARCKLLTLRKVKMLMRHLKHYEVRIVVLYVIETAWLRLRGSFSLFLSFLEITE